MAVNLSPVGGVAAQFFTNTGAVLTGGKIYTYAAGTTTPATTYTTSQGNVAWTNPIVLDAAGRVSGGGEIWLTDGVNYKFVLKDSTDVLIATYDNISGINSNFVAFVNQQEIVTATAGQTVFNLGISYQPATNSLSVFVDGVNQYGPGAQYAYVETDDNTVTFTTGLHVGAEVKFTTTQQQGGGAVDASQVSYLPPFTGSVATNVENKLAQYISVKDFGATGDGVTDDTAAIQAAIDYLNPYVYNVSFDYSQGGGTIFFPRGNYLVTDTIRLPNNVILAGEGCQTYQASLLPTDPYQGSTIYAGAGFSGDFILDTAGYDTVTGLRYTSSTLPTNPLTFAEGCGIRDIGFVNSSGADLDGLRLIYCACAKLQNVSAHEFDTAYLSAHVWNAEYANIYASAKQIALYMYVNNIVDISGQFDCQVFSGVGNDVTSGTKPSWWSSIDTVYASTSVYMVQCSGVGFGAISTQHGSRAVYAQSTSANLDAWYAEDFLPTNPQDPSYITGSALMCANNGSVSTTPVSNNNQSIILVNLLHSESNGVTIFDSIYNSSVTMLGLGQPDSPGAGVGITYGTNTSTGQQILLGNGVLRNSAFPDVGYDARLVYLMPFESSFVPTSYSNIGGTISSINFYWVQTGNLFNVTLIVLGTALTTTNAVVSTPFTGATIYPQIKYDAAGVVTTNNVQTGTAFLDSSNANLYLTNLTSATKIVANFAFIAKT